MDTLPPRARRSRRNAERLFRGAVLLGLVSLALEDLATAFRAPVPPLEQVSATAPLESVDLDRDPAARLRLLPGIGGARAAAILREREAGGPFGSLEALARVHGIGPKTVASLAALEGLRVLPPADGHARGPPPTGGCAPRRAAAGGAARGPARAPR